MFSNHHRNYLNLNSKESEKNNTGVNELLPYMSLNNEVKFDNTVAEINKIDGIEFRNYEFTLYTTIVEII